MEVDSKESIANAVGVIGDKEGKLDILVNKSVDRSVLRILN